MSCFLTSGVWLLPPCPGNRVSLKITSGICGKFHSLASRSEPTGPTQPLPGFSGSGLLLFPSWNPRNVISASFPDFRDGAIGSVKSWCFFYCSKGKWIQSFRRFLKQKDRGGSSSGTSASYATSGSRPFQIKPWLCRSLFCLQDSIQFEGHIN